MLSDLDWLILAMFLSGMAFCALLALTGRS
jgi:hypothetical protein